MMVVEKNTVVVFRYLMKNSKGEVIENTLEGAPGYYLHGSDGIHPSLQSQFEGLKAGDTKIIYLKNENDLLNDDFTFEIIIDKLRPASEEEVMLGHPVAIDNLSCGPGCNCH
jgi:FKBP-type peptidyl-prolyl cis-trans isomerase 2